MEKQLSSLSIIKGLHLSKLAAKYGDTRAASCIEKGQKFI